MGLEKNRENLKENNGEDENDDHSEYDDERTQFILPSSQTHHHHHRLSSSISIVSMADPQNPAAAAGSPAEVPVVVPDKGTATGGGGGQRRSSVQSIISNAHIQLQMLVQDVKGELKELTIGNNNSIKTKLTDDIEKIVGDKKDEIQKTEKSLTGGGGGDGAKEKTVRTGWRRYIGIILGITSSMLFALTILIVKLLAKDYHPYSVSFWRFQGVFLPTFPIVIYYRLVKKQKIFDMVCPPNAPGHPKTLLLVLLRCMTGASAVVLQFYSLQYISMADSSVIAFSTPVFVSLASHVLLGEKSGFIPVICGVITLFGVAVITRPPILTGGEEFDTNTLIGAGMALGCMFCASSTFLLLRYLRQLHFSVITMIFGFWGSFQSVALSATISRFQAPEGLEHWLLAIALASLTFLGQTCITLAFKFEQAGTVSLCRTFDIIFAYIWQFVFLGVVPDKYSFIGGGIVILGVLLAAFRKFLGELPLDNNTRKAFWIILK